jgi:hypothetical protein
MDTFILSSQHGTLPASQNSDSAEQVFIYVTVSWADVEDIGPGAYNEAFLAALRRDLKARETGGDDNVAIAIEPMFTVPAWAASLSPAEQEQHFAAACVHTARRIKDCTIIRGFRLTGFDAPVAAAIKAGLQAKHPAYGYY